MPPGTISFGMVTVPVKLYSALDRKSVRFHQLPSRTGVRIAQKRVDPSTGEEVPYEDIVKGYEIAKDRYVVIEPGELEALEPKKTRTIEPTHFLAAEAQKLLTVTDFGGLDVGIPQAMRRSIDFAANSHGIGAG